MKESEISVGLVEDLPFTRTYVRRTLRRMAPFTLSLEARGGPELLGKLERAVDPPHILLLDIGLSGMTGYDVLKAVRRRYPSIKVLALSVYREAFAVVQMIRLGARGFLEKERMDELGKALSRVIDGGMYFSGGISAEWISAATAETRPVTLTAREQQILRFCAGGFTLGQIAEMMSVCEKTASEYKGKLFRKLNVHNASSMIRVAMGAGLLRIGDPIPSWEEEMRRKKGGPNGKSG